MMDKKAFIHRYMPNPIYREFSDKPIKPSCSNCTHHTYDWFDDGDEFEVCLKNNNLNGPCEDYEEM